MNSNMLLTKISTQGIDATSTDDMVSLACAFWHEDYIPDITKIQALSMEQKRLAGYLTEFFSTFNCVDDKRAQLLQTMADGIKAEVNPNINTENLEDTASKWGLSENMDQHLAELLYYQTRHYKHNR